jgi:hypothetical protein
MSNAGRSRCPAHANSKGRELAESVGSLSSNARLNWRPEDTAIDGPYSFLPLSANMPRRHHRSATMAHQRLLCGAHNLVLYRALVMFDAMVRIVRVAINIHEVRTWIQAN